MMPHGVTFLFFLISVKQFKELEESLRGWASCPRQIRRALLPESAVDHSQKVLEADNRMRSWQPSQQSDWGLLYHCSQAQMDFSSPAGMTVLERLCCSWAFLLFPELSVVATWLQLLG